jgi:hypothetical protein
MDYEQAEAMAKTMKRYDPEILDAINKTAAAEHGVVALRFTAGGTALTIEILDEPYEPNVRIYPGEK